MVINGREAECQISAQKVRLCRRRVAQNDFENVELVSGSLTALQRQTVTENGGS